MRRTILTAVFFALTTLNLSAQNKFEITESLARPKSYVGDYAKVIDAKAERQLETKSAQLRERAGIEFVLVTLETTGAEDIFNYSLEAARRWKLAGRASDKGGLLLMVAVKDRKWWIQVSRTLEADLPDAVVKKIGDKMTVPFRQGQYAEGLNQCVSELIAHLAERRRF
jgi:uncharacterized protein